MYFDTSFNECDLSPTRLCSRTSVVFFIYINGLETRIEAGRSTTFADDTSIFIKTKLHGLSPRANYTEQGIMRMMSKTK
jgi:hypothetical protein